jgi:hypothetical protein
MLVGWSQFSSHAQAGAAKAHSKTMKKKAGVDLFVLRL